MENKTIAIVGATGNMGTALSKSLARAGYPLFLFGRNREEVKNLIDDISSSGKSHVEALASLDEVGDKAEILILAVPYEAEQQLAKELKDSVRGKIVISISNPLNESYDGLVTDPDTSAAEELQEALPNAKVVKSFNTVFAADYAQPNIDGKQIDAFVAGNDDDAVKVVSDIVSSMGLNPLTAGKLSTSRTLEGMQLLLIQLNMKNDYNWVAGWKILHN
jgi:NADPH-dependent F420 reductase